MTMPIPDGSVVITPAQMFAQIGDLTEAVRDLKATVDPAINDMRHDVADHEARIRTVESYGLADVPARVAVLEQRKHVTPAALLWAFGTAIAALGVLVTFLSVVLTK